MLKYYIYMFMLICSLCSCHEDGEEEMTIHSNAVPEQEMDTLKRQNSIKNNQKEKLLIKDSNEYSKRFLEKLLHYPPNSFRFKLQDSIMVVDGQGEAKFPMKLPLNRWKKYSASKYGTFYMLKVKRINYTTILYDIEVLKDAKKIFVKSGEADITQGFWLASDTDTDDSTGTLFGSVSYYDETKSDWIHIGIGINENKARFGIFGNNNNEKTKCPNLKED